MIHIGLFEGIGGFSLAAKWMGWKTYVTCEIAEFPRKVLQYHFPEAYHHSDIHTLNYETINTELSNRYGNEWRNDEIILTGGFPCQPYSQAGKRLGKDDERHLWPQMLRTIQEIKPTYVVGENVRGLTNWNGGVVFEEVCADLESCGYEVQPILLPACAIGAPHRRDRIWFVATNSDSRRLEGTEKSGRDSIYVERESDFGTSSNTNGIINWGESKQSSAAHKQGRSGETHSGIGSSREQQSLCDTTSEGNVTDTKCKGFQVSTRTREISKKEGIMDGEKYKSSMWTSSIFDKSNWQSFPSQSPVCSGDDGLPTKLDGITFPKWRNESIKAYGNAIVPGIAYEIFKAINLLNE